MKKFTFFLAFSLFCFTASAQWVMQNPHPTDRHLRSVVFPDANTGYAVGTRGTIIKSSDGGNNWSVLTSGTTFGLNAVYFIDSNTGFAVGDGGTILKTINGGLSWLPLTACTGFKLNSVYFTDANVGYAVGGDYTSGDSSVIIKTFNGGINWNVLWVGSVTLLNSVCFTDSNTGYIAGFGNGSGIILKTTDGGLTWSSSFSGSDYIFKSVCFSNDSTVYAAGGAAILKTIDRGATWSVVNISTNYNVGFNSIMFSDNSTGYVVGWLDAIYCIRPIILKTMDSGTTWAEPSEMHNLFSSLYSVCFIPSTNGMNDWCAVGINGAICRTFDEGLTWNNISSITYGDLNSIFFTDDSTGFALGYVYGCDPFYHSNPILKTINGGNDWTVIFNSPFCLKSIHFPCDSIGYIVGYDEEEVYGQGVIYKTIDGGVSWYITELLLLNNLYSVYFTDNTTGYIAGNGVCKTMDGGETWLPCTGANGGFYSVCFPDASNGYAVGGNKVIKTTDAGSTWSQLMSAPSDASLNSVFFIDAENGYATGNQFINGHYHGIILKTTDGGSSWTSTSMASPGLLKSICFPEPGTGYAVGGVYTTSGIIYKTDDGGASWTVQSTYPDRSLRSVFFNTLNTGYAVGEDGLILMTPNGGGHVGREEAPPATSALTVHPNPFRERIVIEYEIKNNSSITATIHNHLGQQLRVLVNEYQCKGKHQVEWNAGNLPAGIYYCRFKVEDQLLTKKIVKMQ